MKKLTLSIIVLMAGVIISQSQNSNLANIDEFITEQMEMNHVPGLSAVIIKGDSVIWNNNYGYMILEDSIPVHDSTLFNVFSISKTVSSSCVMQLWDQDYLDLDQNVNDFLPFQIDSPWNDPDSITARMVMSHSSGINDWNFDPFITIGDPTITLEYFLENYLTPEGEYYSNYNFYNAPAGTQFHYDNFGMALTGYLVEPLTGMLFREYTYDALFDPIEMYGSGWYLADINMDNLATGYEYSGGSLVAKPHSGLPAYPGVSLRASALELANFAIMLLNDGIYKGQTILSNQAIDSMETIQNPNWIHWFGITGLGIYQGEGNEYGDRVVWGHKGGGAGGYAAQLFYCEDENSAIVFTTNMEEWLDPLIIHMFDYAGLYVQTNFATDISDTGFTANWTEASIATGYLIDIALDEQFTNILEGFHNYDAGDVLSYGVSNLNSNTEYFYRVRTYNDSDTGAYSNTISATTLLGTDIREPQLETCKIWSSNNKVHIVLQNRHQVAGHVTFYTISGQQLGNWKLKAGLNSIPLNIQKQPIMVKINSGGKIIRKKVMVW